MVDEKKVGELRLPVVRFAPFLALGMAVAYFCSDSFGVVFLAAAVAVLVFSAIKRRTWVLSAVSAIFGFVLMSFYIVFYCQPIISFAGETVTGEIVVSEKVSSDESGAEFVGTMNLGGRKADILFSGKDFLEEGWKAVVTAELAIPDNERELKNLSKGIFLSGEISEYGEITPAGTGFVGGIKKVRQSLIQVLRENLSGESRELALAILFGEDEELSPTLSEYIRISGTAHYTAVSGAHFAVLAAVILSLLKNKGHLYQSLLSIAIAPIALLFFGPTPSVFRASLMFLLNGIAGLILRKPDTLNSLCFAVTVILTVNPGTLLDIGFAMSVLGVLGAGVVGTELGNWVCYDLLQGNHKRLFPIIQTFVVSICAVICTSPVSVAVFKGVSLSGAIVSVLLIPLMTLGMTFALLMGITGIVPFGLVVDIAMKAAGFVVKLFGKHRGFWLTMDFEGAPILAAICAILIFLAVYLRKNHIGFVLKTTAVVSLFAMIMPIVVESNRSEMRFVGNYYTNAAVIIQKNEAAVFISGNGAGLSESISRSMREHGAVKITCLVAFDADFGGAVAINRLSEMCPVDMIYTNAFAAGYLNNPNTKIAESGRLDISGITLASAEIGDTETAANVVLYHGRASTVPENKADAAIYFFATEKELPENGFNARLNRDFRIKLNMPQIEISIDK